MKVLLNGLMMSVASIILMTLLTLGVGKVQAQDIQTHTASKKAQQELVDLFFAAARTGQEEVITEFLNNGFPVDIKNHKGFTPLMMATYYGHQNIVTTLLAHGANRCLRDDKGNTALMGAIFKLEWSIAKQLRKVDCDANAKQNGQKTTEQFAKVVGQNENLQKMIQGQL